MYAGSTECGVEIVQTDFLLGTGDHEDPAELRENIPGTFFDVRYQSAGGECPYSSAVVGFKSLDEATRHVEAAVHTVRWL